MKTRALFSLVSGLSSVQRFSMLKAAHHETVLEHTGMIVIFAFVLATRLNQVPGHLFDMDTVLSKAIVHDWDEVITGDVARPTKYYSATLRQQLQELEETGIAQIAKELETPGVKSIHSAAKAGDEGQLIKLCDLACAIHRCWEEVIIFKNMHFTLPARRLGVVLSKTMKEIQLGKISKEQWTIVDNFALDLYQMLSAVNKSANGELQEFGHADYNN